MSQKPILLRKGLAGLRVPASGYTELFPTLSETTIGREETCREQYYIRIHELFIQIRRAPVDVAVEANVPGPETAESSLYEPPSDSTVFGTR